MKKIQKILNHNAVVAKNGQGNEIVVFGKGIAYHKKRGDLIDTELIDKVFVLSDPETNSKFQELVSQIPMTYTVISERIINYAKIKLERELDDAIYVSLTDHLASVLYRYEKGFTIPNPMLSEISRFYPDEYEIGEKAIGIIKKELKIELPEDEAGFIALHIVNTQKNISVTDIKALTRLIQQISDIVRDYFNIEFDEKSLNYYRFINHVKFFAQRVINNNAYEDNDSEIYELIAEKYPEANNCANEIINYVMKEYSFHCTIEEQVYLIMHIARIVKNI